MRSESEHVSTAVVQGSVLAAQLGCMMSDCAVFCWERIRARRLLCLSLSLSLFLFLSLSLSLSLSFSLYINCAD